MTRRKDDNQHEEISSPTVLTGGTGTLRFVDRVSVAEQRNTGNNAVDAGSLQNHCLMALIGPSGETKRQCVLQAVLDSGLGISIIGEAGLRRLLQYFEGLPLQVVFPFEGAPSMAITDGRSVSLSQQTCMLKESVLLLMGTGEHTPGDGRIAGRG